MNLTSHTVLITGGTSGIGFEMARLLVNLGNTVILTGRDPKRIQEACQRLPQAVVIQSDVTSATDVEKLRLQIKTDFPTLSLLINNVGKAHAYNLADAETSFEKASEEILSNYLASIRMVETFLPLLQGQAEAALVNVSSIAALVGSVAVPTYSASKAALHSYTQLLRRSLQGRSNVKVFEVMPSLVNTEFSRSIGGHTGLSPGSVATELIHGLAHDRYEIHVGATASLYDTYFSNVSQAFDLVNPGTPVLPSEN